MLHMQVQQCSGNLFAGLSQPCTELWTFCRLAIEVLPDLQNSSGHVTVHHAAVARGVARRLLVLLVAAIQH